MHEKSLWRRFIILCIGTFAVCLLGVGAFIAILDPYRNVPFSPALERPMMDVNQRFMYPPLARDPAFDSAVFGTSTIRLLPPQSLNEQFGARFAMLALNSGTAWEQTQIASLFIRHHPKARYLIFSIDTVWCGTEAKVDKLTFRPFPPWMYDESPYNDLVHLLNGKTVEIASRLLSYYLGYNNPRYDSDGYRNFLPPRESYDIDRVRVSIYGGTEPKPIPALPPQPPEDAADWKFSTHAMMAELLRKAPPTTTVMLLFVPYHAYYRSQSGGGGWQLEICKRRLEKLAREVRPDIHILDFMIDSALTRRDENYWDSLHFDPAVADQIVALVAQAVRTGQSGSPALVIR
jgi:hypothetical protein